jgi:hypothetical protein
MSTICAQLHALAEATSETESAAWFATIDAAQINRERNVDWQGLAQGGGWGNLLGGTPEGEEPDLTCWLAPLTNETLRLTADLVQAHPFSCTWFQSRWPLNQIEDCWRQASNPRLPNGHSGLLRFYDPCVLLPLREILRPDQWRLVSAPILEWHCLDRAGALIHITAKPQPVRKSGQLSLRPDQMRQLEQAGRADKIILQMHVNEILAFDHDPFDSYGRVDTVLRLLDKYGLTRAQDQYLFSALTLDWPLGNFSSAELAHALATLDQHNGDLAQVVERYSPNEN